MVEATPVNVAELSKEDRKRYGIAGKPLKASRVLVKGMNSDDFNKQTARATLVIDDHAGTITPANHYNGNLGDNYKAIPRPLPAADSERMGDYAGRGYVDLAKSGLTFADFPALQQVDATTGKPVKATKAAAAS